MFIILKIILTSGIIVLASEIAKKSDKFGSLVTALPLITILTLFWLYYENQSVEKISNHAWYTFWYVIPTLPMFYFFPWFMNRMGFWPTMLISIFICLICFILFAFVVKKFGIDLM